MSIMKFHETGLPQHKLVEEAFNYSFKKMMNGFDENMMQFKQQIDMIHGQNMMQLEAEKKAGMPQEHYDQNKKALEHMRNQQMTVGPQMIREEMAKVFVARRIAPAREAMSNIDAPTPELLAALVLTDSYRSPVDFRDIEGKFGSGVSEILAQIAHIDAYPTERATSIINATPDARRAYQVLMVASLDQMVMQAEQNAAMNPHQMMMLPPGQEQQIFEAAKLLWGTDKKLDARLMAAFNKLSDTASSPFKMEENAEGGVDLVKGVPASRRPPMINGPVITPPKGPSKPGGPDDDVF